MTKTLYYSEHIKGKGSNHRFPKLGIIARGRGEENLAEGLRPPQWLEAIIQIQLFIQLHHCGGFASLNHPQGEIQYPKNN